MLKKIILALILTTSAGLLKAQKTFEIKEGDTTYVMKTYYLCLLNRGENAAKIDSLELQKIQQGHMDHINKMAAEKKIAMAGPMGDNGKLRGILIYTVETKEEAETLAAQDPAVKAGRLTFEIHPWWAAQGSKLP